MCVSCTSIWISNQSIPVKSIFSSLLNVHIRYPHDFFFFSFVLRVSVGRARSFGAELVTPLFLRLSFFFFSFSYFPFPRLMILFLLRVLFVSRNSHEIRCFVVVGGSWFNISISRNSSHPV